MVREILDGISREELQAKTGAPLAFADDCKALKTPAIRGGGLKPNHELRRSQRRIACDTSSRASGKPIVLIHEMGGTIESWDLAGAAARGASAA